VHTYWNISIHGYPYPYICRQSKATTATTVMVREAVSPIFHNDINFMNIRSVKCVIFVSMGVVCVVCVCVCVCVCVWTSFVRSLL
jgi:hypothetical protein